MDEIYLFIISHYFIEDYDKNKFNIHVMLNSLGFWVEVKYNIDINYSGHPK